MTALATISGKQFSGAGGNRRGSSCDSRTAAQRSPQSPIPKGMPGFVFREYSAEKDRDQIVVLW